ncbi:hypothetical protein phytr_3580 [Candidatus Phycorickettsia trachydisci]|uniref:Uncharacterized protein n=1 Tax=Candidatus Phycorickettsia trachydisci TaxID=2115978 RepID=A0A2P1P7Q7_9RICK|nr:hypothetical protein [Candidatus Phycorickettsia trachydisci]AVP87310.1 hypothetical protein phytr_3580 [Candidatus Phycorickettsia trachydisci]
MIANLSQDISTYILHEISNSVGSLNINLELIEKGQYSKDVLELIKEIRIHCGVQIEYFRYLYGSSNQKRSIGDLIKLSREFLKYQSAKIILSEELSIDFMLDAMHSKFLLAFINILALSMKNQGEINIHGRQEDKLSIRILASRKNLREASVENIQEILRFATHKIVLSNNIVAYYLQSLKELSKTQKLDYDYNIIVDDDVIEFSFYV